MLKFYHPSNLIVTGQTSAGKSQLVRNIVKSNVYDYDTKNILWCYSVWQPWFREECNIRFKEGLPQEDDKADLIIIDDQMNNINNKIAEMFTVTGHHKNYSIILITQNLFPRVRQFRDISLNAHYFIIFRNNRDLSQVSCFARQAFPGKGKYFLDAYKKATEKPYSYLLVDVHPQTPDEQRLRESVFPEHGCINWVYLPSEK